MRPYPILLVTGVVMGVACSEPDDSSTDGTLIVSTSSGGSDPDQDGYLLIVDDVDSLVLEPSGIAGLDVPAGQHTLALLGMAEHCTVAPATPLEVDVPPQEATPVAFEIICNLTGARITTTTSGLDFDPDGYRFEVDAVDRGILPSNGTAITRLDPGSRTITLTGIAPNCTSDGTTSRTVTIESTEVEAIAFAVVCVATTGVVGVLVEASGRDVQGDYVARLDGTRAFGVGPGQTAYLPSVAPGDHVISLAGPGNCLVESDPQSVTVTAGGLIRDTVAATFLVTCSSRSQATLWITAPTSGPIPAHDYSVWICDAREYYCRYGGLGSSHLGALRPNGRLAASVAAGQYVVWLRDVPAKCSVQDDSGRFATVQAGRALDVEFPVTCLP